MEDEKKPSRKAVIKTLCDFLYNFGMEKTNRNDSAMESFRGLKYLTQDERNLLNKNNEEYKSRQKFVEETVEEANKILEESNLSDLLKHIRINALNGVDYISHYEKYGIDFALKSLPDSIRRDLFRGCLLGYVDEAFASKIGMNARQGKEKLGMIRGKFEESDETNDVIYSNLRKIINSEKTSFDDLSHQSYLNLIVNARKCLKFIEENGIIKAYKMPEYKSMREAFSREIISQSALDIAIENYERKSGFKGSE